MLKTVAAVLLVAGAYYVSGRLGLLLAIPPGYATAVWPPSGIALAAVLLGGARLAPGIFIGSFLINVGTGFSPDALAASLGVPGAVALGATLQALLGAWLIRRDGHEHNLLAGGADVGRILMLGGPLACLLNATVGVGGLWLAGRAPVEAVPFNWWTWWIGDSIGVLLFAPLVLIWAVRPYRTWLRRQIYVTAPLATLFAVVVVLFVFISQREQARIEAGFRALAADIHQGLRIRLNTTLGMLSSIEGFYASSQEVEPYEFEIFAQRLTAHLAGVSALSWNPVVRDAQRAAFEARARRSGYAGFGITERAADGSLRPAGRRGLYVPVQAIAPRAGNEAAIGFNAASEPVRRAAMEQARDTGQPVASASMRLVQNSGPGVLVALPVYRHGVQEYTLEARRRYLQGYAVAEFSLEGMLADAAQRAKAHGLRLALVDISTPDAAAVIYGSPEGSRSELREELPFSFAGRSWRMDLTLAEQALIARRSWEAWFVLAGGLLLTALLGIVALLGVGRTAHIEALVTERTEELRRTAAQLARSNRELEQYAYVTSHDLKAPLRSISSFAALLAQRYGHELQGEGREFLGFITGGVAQMQELIDDLLQLSRVDARKLEVSPLSMRVAVDRACSALAADLSGSRTRLFIGELPFVRGDLHMLSQLWQNLLGNAIKFQRPGQAPEIRIAAEERSKDWRFSISDNGIGVAPAHYEQIFMVFRRLHAADAYPGTGIGLAICKKVVQLHGGEIWVESTVEGEGATFAFTLSKNGPQAPAAPPAG